MRISEDHELEKVMLEDKMKMTDWEATNEAIEEQIARESYVEWLKDNERKLSKSKKVKFTATATATTTSNNLSSNSSPKWGDRGDEKQKSPKLSPRLSPKAGSSGLNSHHHHSYGNFVETGTFVNQFHPQMFGKLAVWFLSKVLITSNSNHNVANQLSLLLETRYERLCDRVLGR